MTVKMEALRTFAGAEGFFKKGQLFEVRDEKRARQLAESGLATISQGQPTKSMNEEMPLPEEQKPTEEPEQVNPPSQGESWGVKALGGGWYELPSGERVQGFDKAKEGLYEELKKELDQQPSPEAEVRSIPPTNEPKIVFTGEPEEKAKSSDEEKPKFEDEVTYLGGGWYELPNGERVQGKESAKDLFETYLKERRDS